MERLAACKAGAQVKWSQRVVLASFVAFVLLIVGKSVLPAWLYVAVFPLMLLAYWLAGYLERRNL